MHPPRPGVHRRSGGGDSRGKIPGPGKRTTSNHSLGPKTEMGLIRPHVRRPGGQVSGRALTAAAECGPGVTTRDPLSTSPHGCDCGHSHSTGKKTEGCQAARSRSQVWKAGSVGFRGHTAPPPRPCSRGPPWAAPTQPGGKTSKQKSPKISSGITRGLSQANLVTESLLGEIFSSNTFPLQIHPASNAYILPSKVNL